VGAAGEQNNRPIGKKKNNMKTMILTGLPALAALGFTGCASSGSKHAGKNCDGSCCKSAEACAKCCGTDCAACCKK
jgi:hypothetical protein